MSKTFHQDDIITKPLMVISGEYPNNKESYEEHFDEWDSMSIAKFREYREFAYKASIDILSQLQIGQGSRKTIDRSHLDNLHDKWLNKCDNKYKRIIINNLFASIN